MGPHGLHRVSDAELKRLLKALHSGTLRFPLTRAGLIEAAFGHVEVELDALVGLDKAAVQALLVALLQERQVRADAAVELQWMAPGAPGTRSRDVLDLVKELLSGAERSVQVLGLTLDDDPTIARSLRALVGGRGVDCGVVLDVHGQPEPAAAARQFLERNFPDRHRPSLSFAAFPVRGRGLVVDAERVLLTSGLLSATEEQPGLDAGALVRDAGFAQLVLDQWQRLVLAGHVRPVGG